MANDTHPETKSHQQSPREQLRSGRQDVAQNASRGRMWKHGLLAFGVIAVLASAVALIAGAMSSQETGPKLTHTITRGDLIVTVTEQGTLESADNTEIKCQVRGQSTVIWVIEGGSEVKPGDELVRLDTLAIGGPGGCLGGAGTSTPSHKQASSCSGDFGR